MFELVKNILVVSIVLGLMLYGFNEYSQTRISSQTAISTSKTVESNLSSTNTTATDHQNKANHKNNTVAGKPEQLANGSAADH